MMELKNSEDIKEGNVLGSLKQGDVMSRCVYPFNRIVVNPHGFVVACTADFHKQLEIGDTTKNSLIDIWNGKEFKYLRNKHLNNELEGIYCNKCINNIECKTTNLWNAFKQGENLPHYHEPTLKQESLHGTSRQASNTLPDGRKGTNQATSHLPRS